MTHACSGPQALQMSNTCHEASFLSSDDWVCLAGACPLVHRICRAWSTLMSLRPSDRGGRPVSAGGLQRAIMIWIRRRLRSGSMPCGGTAMCPMAASVRCTTSVNEEA